MTKHSILAPALVLATLFVASLGVFSRYSITPSGNAVETKDAKFIKVVDWDTIKVSYWGALVNVRVLWIDTPEKYILKKGYVECYWEESSAWARMFFSGATSVTLRTDAYSKSVDQYGRLLRHVYVSGEDYSKKAIEAGMGVYTSGFTLDNSGSLMKAEELAKNTKAWLWKACDGQFKPQ